MDGSSFLFVGLLGGFAYLAHAKERFLIAYGLALLALAFVFQGFAELAPDTAAAQGYVTFLGNARNVSLGAGFSFLGYVGAIEGYRYWLYRRDQKRRDEEAFQLRISGRKDAEPAANPR